MEQYKWSVGGSPEEVLRMLESLPNEEKVHTWTIEEAINTLQSCIERRHKIQEEQEIHMGQGGNMIYHLKG